MLRLLTLLCLICGPFAALANCSTGSLIDRLSPDQRGALAAAVAAAPHGEGLVWQATRGAERLVLVGTLHLPDPRHADLIAALRPEIAAADLMLVEAAPGDQAALQTAVQQDPSMIFITDGPTLPEMLDETTWDLLAQALRERGMMPALASRFRPWFLMATLSVPPCAMADLANVRAGLDNLLMAEAEALGLPVQSLEPWRTLFDLLGAAPDADQMAMLRVGLLPTDIQEDLLVAMLDGYFAGRVAEVWELGRVALGFVPGLDPAEGALAYDEMGALLLDGRNRAWLPVIEAATADHDRIIVAVGAAHLPGKAGLIALLQAAGWGVERLR